MSGQRTTPALIETYWDRSRRPLASLALLLPLLVFHELGVLFGGRQAFDGGAETVAAYRLIERLIAGVGFVAAVPALLTMGILVAMHVRRGDPWTLKPATPLLMAVEAACWSVPLLVVQSVLGAAMLAAPAGGVAAAMGWQDRLNLAVGAGLYEELLFRLLLVGGTCWALAELLGASRIRSSVVAVAASSVLFALYHDLSPSDGRDVSALFVVYAFGGVYFGVLFLMRGFGIVAATHAVYDIAVLSFASGGGEG